MNYWDRTVEIISGMCSRDPRIRLIVNTRNFGQMRSPTHGIYQAGGKAIISMCADFPGFAGAAPRIRSALAGGHGHCLRGARARKIRRAAQLDARDVL